MARSALAARPGTGAAPRSWPPRFSRRPACASSRATGAGPRASSTSSPTTAAPASSSRSARARARSTATPWSRSRRASAPTSSARRASIWTPRRRAGGRLSLRRRRRDVLTTTAAPARRRPHPERLRVDLTRVQRRLVSNPGSAVGFVGRCQKARSEVDADAQLLHARSADGRRPARRRSRRWAALVEPGMKALRSLAVRQRRSPRQRPCTVELARRRSCVTDGPFAGPRQIRSGTPAQATRPRAIALEPPSGIVAELARRRPPACPRSSTQTEQRQRNASSPKSPRSGSRGTGNATSWDSCSGPRSRRLLRSAARRPMLRSVSGRSGASATGLADCGSCSRPWAATKSLQTHSFWQQKSPTVVGDMQTKPSCSCLGRVARLAVVAVVVDSQSAVQSGPCSALVGRRQQADAARALDGLRVIVALGRRPTSRRRAEVAWPADVLVVAAARGQRRRGDDSSAPRRRCREARSGRDVMGTPCRPGGASRKPESSVDLGVGGQAAPCYPPDHTCQGSVGPARRAARSRAIAMTRSSRSISGCESP